MQLLSVLLWPKPRARQRAQHDSNINLQFATRTFSTPVVAARVTTPFLYAFVINALLLTTTTWGLTTTQQPAANYEGASTNTDVNVVSTMTGLSNGYAIPNYMKNYYQVNEDEASTQQQQQLQQQQQQQLQQQHHHNNAVADALKLRRPGDLAAADITRGGFVGMQPSNYGNSFAARGTALGVGGGENGFTVYDSGFMPTTFTAAGQHYTASLVGLRAGSNKINTMHQYATTAASKNNLHASQQPYGNVNSINSNTDVDDSKVADNKAQHSLFRRLSNYGGVKNVPGGGRPDDTSRANLNAVSADDNGDGGTIDGTDPAELMQNYALTYADDVKQSSLMQDFYNQQAPHNDVQSVQEQTIANYFPQSMASTAGYEIENQPKYYTLNNYQQTTKPQKQQSEQQSYIQYQQQPLKLTQQQQQQLYKKLEIFADRPTPATYYQTYIQHINDDKDHRQQNRHVADDNYHRWKQNQYVANFQPKQSATEKQDLFQYQQQQQQQQQTQPGNRNHPHHSQQEPDAAETSVSSRSEESPGHKSKRHDSSHAENGPNFSYDTLAEQNDNTIEHGSDDLSLLQVQQLARLQEQLQHQQQQFIALQHQLIDHDQQLQIQKHTATTPTPTLPPITQTVHHNPHSLQALAGSPLSKHTQIIRNIPIPHLRQVHVPYRENVTIEVPDPIIAAIRRPYAIQIPITTTMTVPKIQEVKIPIEKIRPFPVERPIPYIVERKVPYPVEKQIAQPVYYPVPIKVPILHTVVHRIHRPHGPQHQPGYNLPLTVYQKGHGRGHGHGHGHSHH